MSLNYYILLNEIGGVMKEVRKIFLDETARFTFCTFTCFITPKNFDNEVEKKSSPEHAEHADNLHYLIDLCY